MPEVTLTLTAAKVITAKQINKAFGKLKVEIVSATAIGTDGRKWTVVFPTPEAAGTAKAKADYDLTINNGRVGLTGDNDEPRRAPQQAAQPLPQHHLERRPYAHVLVPLEATALPVTWHDGTSSRDRISGELRCTMTTLTPLICGNEQFGACGIEDLISITRHESVEWLSRLATKIHERSQGKRKELARRWVDEHVLSVGYKEGWLDKRRFDTRKAVLEPLRSTDEAGPVLIPGQQLKGMVRQSLGALLGAPMERVAEQSYSYRPALTFTRAGLEPRPARVTKTTPIDGFTLPTEVEIFALHRPNFDAGGARYRGGIEGWTAARRGLPELAKARLHLQADLTGASQGTAVIAPSVHEGWIRTYKHLRDEREGHISSRHPSVHNDHAKALRTQAYLDQAFSAGGFQIGDVIFVEWDTHGPGGVLSYGSHCRYRWRYADTVRMKWQPLGASTSRPELTARAFEKVDRPTELTGARALFGYSGDNPGSEGIGKDDHTQLAGRIAFNTAIEDVGARAPKERFLEPKAGFVVPLKELGTPKASSPEFYLDQSQLPARRQVDGGEVVTYGDIPGRDPTGALAGRKFYRHCPSAATDPTKYADGSPQNLMNSRSALARFVSTPGTPYRFTVRFRDLSAGELGGLLLALCPDQYAAHLPSELGAKSDGTPEQPRYATKLGHGRPLGLGSVRIHADAVLQLKEDPTGYSLTPYPNVPAALTAFSAIANHAATREWLSIHDYRESTWADYPRKDNEIFNWHTNVRRKHSEGRRRAP